MKPRVPIVIRLNLGTCPNRRSCGQQTLAYAHVDEKKAAAEQRLSQLTKGALNPEEIDHLVEDALVSTTFTGRSPETGFSQKAAEQPAK